VTTLSPVAVKPLTRRPGPGQSTGRLEESDYLRSLGASEIIERRIVSGDCL
jgi:hypothetical protein